MINDNDNDLKVRSLPDIGKVRSALELECSSGAWKIMITMMMRKVMLMMMMEVTTMMVVKVQVKIT